MNIALTNDLQQRLREKVDNGEFPSEEAVVEEALKCFLIQEPSAERSQASSPSEVPDERLPGPFLEDMTALAPIELPRLGRAIACSSLHNTTRQPTLFPGE
jgi:Arc/MetJ-type ribon-helix-helix transcriptional regulator